MNLRALHPIVLLGSVVFVAAGLTWIMPAGQYDRRDDPITGRRVVVAGTYHRVPAAPVGPFAAVVALPRGFVAAADVIAVVLFVGGAWVVVDRLGALPAIVNALVGRFADRGLWIVTMVALFFAAMGALENMQEEIIPLVPALVALGGGVGLDALAVVAMSAGAAMVGSAFGPTNPFQAGIALKLAELPPLSAGVVRSTLFVGAVMTWIAWTIAYARRTRRHQSAPLARGLRPEPAGAGGSRPATAGSPTPGDLQGAGTNLRVAVVVFAIALAPMAAYVYGALRLDWGFNELSGAFVTGGMIAGLVGGLGVSETVVAYLDGMRSLLPAALMVGIARSISLVLDDGRIVDTILDGLVTPLAGMPAKAAAMIMIPFQALIHVAVPSVSGQAVLTMPLFVPLADVLGLSREVPVLAYQTGAGLMELATPTNGALMAILLAAGVPFSKWLPFAVVGAAMLTLIGVLGIVLVR
jgi:uncharacterized ion transporter superfamily protein YfcC